MTNEKNLPEEDVFELTEIVEDDDLEPDIKADPSLEDDEFEKILMEVESPKPETGEEMTAEEEGLNDSLGDDLDIESLFADLDKEEKDQEPVSETREQQDLGQSEEDLSQLEPTLEESAETGLEELDLELEISDTEEALGQETQPAAAREEAADEAVFQESRVEDDDLKDMDLGEDIQLGELEGLISDLDQDDGREPDEEMRAMLDADDQKTPEVSPEVLTKIKALEEKIKDLQTKMESAAALDAEEIVQMVDQRMQKAASAAPARQDEADLIEKIRDRVQTQVREGLDEWQAQKDELYADVKMLKEKFSGLTALEEKIEGLQTKMESAAALDTDEIVQMVDQRMQKAASAAPAQQDGADLIEKIRDRVQAQVREGLDEWQAQKDELYADVKMLKEKFSELTALEEKIEAQRQARESAVDPAQLESELMIKIKAELERLVPETAARILREEIAGLKK